MRRFLLVCMFAGTRPAIARSQPVRLTRQDAVRDAIARSPRSGIVAADTLSAFALLLTARALPNPTLSTSYSKSPPNYHVTADLPIDYLWVRGNRIRAAELSRTSARYRFLFGRAGIELDADTTYTSALATAAKSRLSARTAQDVDSLRRMAESRRNAGDASELDV